MTVIEGLELGVELGWWPSYDKDRLEPEPWPWCYVIKDKVLKRETYHPRHGFALWEDVTVLDATFLSQLLPHIGAFKSITEARKNGHGIELKPGEYWFKRRTIHLYVEDE